MSLMIADEDVEVLAREMFAHFPADAADQAALRASAFFDMAYFENSKKWLLVHGKIREILADADTHYGPRSIVIGT